MAVFDNILFAGDLQSLSQDHLAQPEATNASSIPAAMPASQSEAAETSSKANQQLPAQLRHRGHAEPPLTSEAAGDPMQPPQPGAATMSREAREPSEADADGKAAKLAALARGQANSSEVHSVMQHMLARSCCGCAEPCSC